MINPLLFIFFKAKKFFCSHLIFKYSFQIFYKIFCLKVKMKDWGNPTKSRKNEESPAACYTLNLAQCAL